MVDLFHRNRQLLLLTVLLVVVWGLSALVTLPRLEDPLITQRDALVITTLPGATPERVESLVTEPLESALLELEEVEHLDSTSSAGTSVIAVTLKDSIRQVDPVWGKVRNRIDDARPRLPREASEPEFRDGDIGASALIAGLTWELPGPANMAILTRLANDLESRLRAIPGTDRVEISGEPEEEIRVAIGAGPLARLGFTAGDLSERIAASDAKEAAGQVRGRRSELLIEVEGALDSLERIRAIPLQAGADGVSARLGQVAAVSRGVRSPASRKALVHGHPAVVVSATVASGERVDRWAGQARQRLAEVRATLPEGLGLHTVLDQSRYVEERLDGVIGNLITGSLLVVAVSVPMLGGRAALVLGAALPLSALMVFGWMRLLEIPLHQMSATGLVIALGLLIDNAIVVVDEVQQRLRAGVSGAQAVRQAVRHLLVPMVASTLTTVLAFVPIATSPGATGEFIGTIGLTVILALLSSLFLSLTVIPALTAHLQQGRPLAAGHRWWDRGLSPVVLAVPYRRLLRQGLRRPGRAVALSLLPPVLGFLFFGSLEQQFFPPTNRDQFQIELRLPRQSPLARTEALAMAVRQRIRRDPRIQDVHWFLGESAPPFFYNVIAGEENAPHYAQGLVQLRGADQLRETIRSLQGVLDGAFPEAQILVKQLEQGPPFDAPIELRLEGADLDLLRHTGDDLRRHLAHLEGVTHTAASLSEALPRVALAVDEEQAQRSGLDNRAIARQLQAGLEGAVGGSILEGVTTVPVRVQVEAAQRSDLQQVASLDVVAPGSGERIPLTALARLQLEPEVRLDRPARRPARQHGAGLPHRRSPARHRAATVPQAAGAAGLAAARRGAPDLRRRSRCPRRCHHQPALQGGCAADPGCRHPGALLPLVPDGGPDRFGGAAVGGSGGPGPEAERIAVRVHRHPGHARVGRTGDQRLDRGAQRHPQRSRGRCRRPCRHRRRGAPRHPARDRHHAHHRDRLPAADAGSHRLLAAAGDRGVGRTGGGHAAGSLLRAGGAPAAGAVGQGGQR